MIFLGCLDLTGPVVFTGLHGAEGSGFYEGVFNECDDREAFWECVWAQTAANGFSSSRRHVWPLWNPVCVREPGPVDLIDGIHTFTGEK